ncbi:phosphopantetheine-binding protein [Streptomyces sp. NPDC060184]|uniref:phosphopantetheine-binding protein n=1 Tax=Streptomyces sp. NPDC060184 TaxID=3347064 RepID=UPI003663E0D4
MNVFAVMDARSNVNGGKLMEESIRSILADPGILGDAAASLARDADIRLAGVSSMQIVQILMEVESRFEIEIPEDMIRPETFRSIGVIAEAVEVVVKQQSPVGKPPNGEPMDRASTAGTRLRAPGVEMTSRADESVLDGLRASLARLFAHEVDDHYTAPPVIARSVSERAGYPSSFPHLLGEVHGALPGSGTGPSDLVLTSAACHHLYPLISEEWRKELGCLSVEAACYRGEATAETGRLRSFRMYEIVRWGAPDDIAMWRHRALSIAESWLRDLGLSIERAAANDPFFGSAGRYLASAQQSEQLKWEMLADVDDGVNQAVASVNYHKDHFGEAFGLARPDGSVGHSACLAFGLDRLLLALKQRYGSQIPAWPETIRARLEL